MTANSNEPAVSQWYVVETFSQKERKASYELSRRGYAVFLPMETDWGLTKQGKPDHSTCVYSPRLPGYFFVLIDETATNDRGETQFREVSNIEGVIGFVDCFDPLGQSMPWPVPPAAILEMQIHERAGLYDLRVSRDVKPETYRPKRGERVQITAGPYLTYLGRVLSAPKKNRVHVQLDDGPSPRLLVSQVSAA